MSAHRTRRLLICLAAVVATGVAIVAPTAPAQARPLPTPVAATSTAAIAADTELIGVCALKSNGLMRAAASPSDCAKNETYVALKPGPVNVCVQPSGSSRYVASLGKCRKPALGLVLPPASGSVWFCADASTGTLRYVTDPSLCLAGEVVYSVTPNDSAPSVSSTSPATGATGLPNTVSPSVTFSEAVTLDPAALTLVCASLPVAGAVTGSGTGTVTFDPTANLPAGSQCVLTVAAAAVHDVDALDPPDTMTADVKVSFSTDAAPTLLSIDPSDATTGVSPAVSPALTFSEPVDVAAGAVTLTCGATPVPAAISGSGTATIVIDPTDDLAAATPCQVHITASGITDVDAADPPDALGSDADSSFTTADAAPQVTTITPVDGGSGIAASADVVVTFSEPVTATDGAITLACPSGTPVPVTLGGSPGTTITAHPATPLTLGATCTATVDAAYITDVDAIDPPDHPTANTTATFTVAVDNPPTDLALSASVIAENQPTGTSVGTFSTTDPDVGDTFTYTLVAGAGDTDNASFAISGAGLQSAASFDFETKASYSIRVRTTDSAGASVEKSFTITVTNVNEAPSSTNLSASTVTENLPGGTLVGTLSAVDPDAGQTLAYSLVAAGCAGSFPDGSAFSISGTSLVTAAPLDFETKASYAACLQVTDNGAPSLSTDTLLTITVLNANDAPVATPNSYSGVIGNTLALVGTSAPGAVTLTGAVLISDDTDQDGDPLNTMVETVATTLGGTATVAADGSFTYLPPIGVTSQADTFTYHVTDGLASAGGTVTLTIGSSLVWYVDSASSAVTHDGRSTSPLTSLTALNEVGDLDGAGDTIFVATGSGSYAGGLALEANQQLLGSPAGLTVSGTTLVPAGGAAPVITNSAGNGLDLASGVSVQGVNVSGASADGLHGVSITTASVGTTTGVNVTGSGGDGVDLSGAANGNVTIAATIGSSAGRSVAVSGRTGGTASFTGAITGKGIEVSANNGATVSFTGVLTITTTTTSAFSATGGGTITATGAGSALTSTTGTALVVDSTTIGSAGLIFRSVSSNGAVNGIRLKATGGLGGLSVTGGGSTTRGGDGSGGTITNSTGAGVLLTTTRGVSLNNLSITNSANGPGVSGTGVTNFTFSNGTITGSGSVSKAVGDSGLAFNSVSAGVVNLDGVVTVTNNVLGTAYAHGVDMYNQAGVISTLTITGNAITSSSSTAASVGSAVLVQALGSAAGAATVGGGSVSTNTITGFPTGGGILLYGGNVTSAAAPQSTFGSAATPVTVNGNLIQGASAAIPMNTQLILLSMAGRGSGVVNVTNNGTAGSPLAFNKGNAVSINSAGAFTLTSSVTGNVVSPQTQIGGSLGIAGGADMQVLADGATADSAVLNLTVSNNTVTNSAGSGIRFLANSTGTLRARITNNTVAAPFDQGGSAGIRIDSGTNVGPAVDTTVCLDLTGNATAGSLNAVGDTAPGIGLRKQGTVATTNDFGIVGLTTNPATQAQTIAYVDGLNPASTSGTGSYGTAGVYIVSGSNFVPCTLPF